jgi:hypothetical protein
VRESEEVDLVLGDENAFDFWVDPGKAAGVESDVLLGIASEQGVPAIENPETDALRFVAESRNGGRTGSPRNRGIDRRGRQNEIQPVRRARRAALR